MRNETEAKSSAELPTNAGARTPVEDAALARLSSDEARFADLLTLGSSQSFAYEQIWPGKATGTSLRSRASKLANSKKIKLYISLRAGRDPAQVTVVSRDERKQLLSELVRGRDPNARIRASTELSKMESEDRAERLRNDEQGSRDPFELLKKLCGINVVVAATLAAQLKIPIPPSLVPTREAWGRLYDEWFSSPSVTLNGPDQSPLHFSGTPGERARKAHFVETNTRRPEDDEPNLPDDWDTPPARRTREGIMPDALTNDFRQGGPGELNPFANGTNSRRSKLR